jgi:chemotaxis protein CheC
MMKSETGPVLQLSGDQMEAIATVVSIGTVQAGRALSRLTGVGIQISPPEVAVLSMGDVPPLFGGMDAPAYGVLVPFQGDVEGNTLLLFPEEGIGDMQRLLFPADDDPSEEMLQSAFAEVGNILSGTFLTVLSSLSERILLNLPPTVAHDMAGAIIDAILAGIGATSDSVLALISGVSREDGGSLVRSIILPDPAAIELLLEAARRLRITG